MTEAGLPPLVLLHGGFGSWTHWVRNILPLRQKRTIWTLDLPGLGESDDVPAPASTEHFAQLVLSGVSTLLGARSTFELAGFSFGAMIAAHMAAQADARCSRLTLIGAAGCGQLHVQVPLLAPPSPQCLTEEAETIQRENLARLMLHSPASIDDLAVHVHASNLRSHRFNSRKLSRSDDLWRALPRIKASVVAVWGAQDATAGGVEAIDQREALFRVDQPDCEFHVLESVGHWAMYEAPEQVNHILDYR
jgi:pimeloyl-ACP methyl ester carboxylesterase